ncbi:MAG: hypothetical protein ACT4PL_07870, partial [Phycisphaerales bacterium]
SLLLLAVCGSTAAAQVPANDLCANAQTVTVGSIIGSTVNALVDGTSTCGPGASTTPDVWYRFVAVGAGTLSVSTCGPNTNYDTVVSIRSACPGSGSTLACNDDDATCTSNGGNSSRASRALLNGQIVFIRVAGTSGATGTFNLTLTYNVPPPPTGGPDVTVGVLTDVARYGTNSGGLVTAYAVGTESCNVGDIPIAWYDTGNRLNEHPVIAQNMYRLLNGRFEQIGQSWLKHGFASTNTNLSYCGSCIQPPDGGDQLGVNCTDAYGSGLNGGQTYLGPRSQVNPANGFFPIPHGSGSGLDGVQGSTIGMRLQVPTADVTGQGTGQPNFGAIYFVDAHYVTMDDARFLAPGSNVAMNGLNNLTYQRINIAGGTGTPTLMSTPQRQLPGIRAWKDTDPTVTLVAADYNEPHPDGDPNHAIKARFWVGGKVTDLGNGQFHYEYAVFNLNSDRAGGTFSVPLPAGASIANVGFRHPLSHSGEAYSNAAWTTRRDGDTLVFETQPFATNANANAIRWSTLYNFRFDSNVAPTTGDAVIGLFKPGTPATAVASGMPVPTVPVCAVDFNHDGFATPDDLDDYITCFFDVPACAQAEFNGDGIVSPDDLDDFITAFFNGC